MELDILGHGPDILFLRSGFWIADEAPFIETLTTLGRVVAPVHPGFGNHDAPPALTSVDDLAYFYLDLIDTLHLQKVMVVGAGFGGWIAAEMAIKTDNALATLVLIDPLGIKHGDRETRSITDVFAHPDSELLARAFKSPKAFDRDLRDMTDYELARRVRSREAYARYGWSPYMHDPKLPGRLHRVRAPTQVIWGEQDRIVDAASCRVFGEKVPHARCTRVADAGHFPHLEQPGRVIKIISDFSRDLPGQTYPTLMETR